MGFLTKKKVVEKQYFNNLFLERISNVCFDLMIAASRITSYNVCYTKLLRGGGRFLADELTPLVGGFHLHGLADA